MSESTGETATRGVFELPGRQAYCETPHGSLLTVAAEAAGVMLNVACGGTGACGGCAVELLEGRFADVAGRPLATGEAGKHVLACRTRVESETFRIRVPRHSLVSAGESVVVDFEHLASWTMRPTVRKHFLKLPQPSLADQRSDVERIAGALAEAGVDHSIDAPLEVIRLAPRACRAGKYEVTVTLAENARTGRASIVRVESGDTTGRLFAVAVDVGTTTVVCSLVDLTDGRIVDSASSYNQQVRRCDDVASRISHAATPRRLADLQSLVVDATINRLVGMLTARQELAANDIARMSVSGNTVMTHLLLGVDPTHLGGVPFQSAHNAPGPVSAGELGVAINPAGFVDLAPSVTAYFGGDAVCAARVCEVGQGDELTLVIDVGTNAEIAVGNQERIIACAAPAGPAFEGHGITCGVRAAVGAIDGVTIDPADYSCRYTVIGESAPVGLCGSAMVDFLGQAFAAGLVNAAGRFTDDAKSRCKALRTVAGPHARDVLAHVLVEAEQTDDRLAPIVITEADIATLLQAKGVIFAAVQMALKHFGADFSDIAHAFLAGGFARHINLPNAVTLGMLPDIPLERYHFVGNTSLAGAYLSLVDKSVAPSLLELAKRPEVIELNLDPEFQDTYAMAMMLPNADASLFPSAG